MIKKYISRYSIIEKRTYLLFYCSFDFYLLISYLLKLNLFLCKFV